MKFLVFSDQITATTTATGYVCKIQGEDTSGDQDEDELSKMFLVHTAVAYRDPSVTAHMQSYVHVVVDSNKSITNHTLTLTEGDIEWDIIRPFVRNEKDDQSWTFADGSHASANKGTQLNLYISLVHNNI